ncbi:MAG TPA: quinone-dependent dihydroorotate dehydrogenase [Polyangiaceae bacterium]|nr:quinone-dependent dihydroorotate dehydrogenase [Polyangiaceae bacterium]
MYARALRPLLFVLPAHAAHTLAFAALGPLEHVPFLRALTRTALGVPVDPRLAVHALGLDFASPVGLAAGFDKDARRARALAALGFGHLELGTVTAIRQAANPRPNLFRLPDDRALVNRLGFPNDGAERVARRLRAARRSVPNGIGVPVGVSIGKSRVVPADDLDAVVKDYARSFDLVRSVADFVVVNVSSPNTAGLRAMQAREHATALLLSLTARAGGGGRLLVKIAPDLDDAQLEDVLAVAESVGLGGVVATNTTTSREGLRTNARRVAAIGAGGLSGPPLQARAISVVRRIRARLGRRVAVVGVGGIERAEHAMAMIRAGADLVQLYTGFIYEGPGIAARMGRELLRLMEREGARAIGELVGVAG